MNIISRAHIIDYKRIKKGIAENDYKHINFYSEYKENLFYYIVSGKCFLIKNGSDIQSIIIIKNLNRQIIYIPAKNKGITFFKLLFYLTKYMHVEGYTLEVKYRSLNISKYKKYYDLSVIENIKIMKGCTDIFPANDLLEKKSVNFRIMELSKDENIRVELQNKIFYDVKGRRELKIEEVKKEETKPGFISNMCYFIEADNHPAGYGQILFLDDDYYLVNFGIIPEYRQRGLGYYFLNQILYSCYENGLDSIYLSVDNNNQSAVNLYEKAGFKEVYNKLTIKI
jgi:GNAT superfamily N-acetyltransferase